MTIVLDRRYIVRPTRIEIDLVQAHKNFKYIRDSLNAGTRTTAVVKANAYGHGVIPFARVAKEAGYESLAVAMPEEAVPIRRAGITLPIYILGLTQPQSFILIADTDTIPAVCDSTDLESLNSVARMYGKVIRCMVAVDTGMHRIGIKPENALAFLEKMDAFKHLAVEGFFTHMWNADADDKSDAYKQIALFKKMMETIKANRLEDYVYSMNNSAGSLAIPESQFNVVRPGIILYGVSPFRRPLEQEEIKPVLSLKSEVLHIQHLVAGDTISYGGTYTCSGNETIATIPIGYGDGYPRLLSNKGVVLIGGKRCPIVGRVCMDQIMVKIPEGLKVEIGDEVVLIGKQKDDQIFIEELAEIAGTIPYEIFCCFTDRVPRVYF